MIVGNSTIRIYSLVNLRKAPICVKWYHIDMVPQDPYPRSGARRYECRSCLSVVVADERVTDCPDCGGRVQNVSVPRE